MKALPSIAIAGFLAAAAVAPAQTAPDPNAGQPAGGTSQNPSGKNTTDEENPAQLRFWQGNMPGGNYTVALDRVVSVSRHSYAIVEAGLLVDEVVIDTAGQSLARFYYVKPITEGTDNNSANRLANRAKELVDYGSQRTNTNLQQQVAKKYPEGIYAHTVEYRLDSAEALTSLYNSVRTAWMSGRGRIFSFKSK